MTFQQFLEKYNGKSTDFDGYYGFQCMDLMHQYVYEVLGLTDKRILSAYLARQVFENFDSIVGREFFDRVENSPDNMPAEGDIVFYKAPYGKFTDTDGSIKYAGHVAICVSATLNKMILFEQNYNSPTCQINEHTYGYCLGWLHPKTIQPDLQAQLNQAIDERNRNWNYFIGLCDIMKVAHVYDLAKAELEKLVRVEDVVRKQEEIIKLKEDEVAKMREEIASIRSAMEKALEVNTEAQKTIVEQVENLKKQEDTINQLDIRVKELEKIQPIEQYTGFDLIVMGLRRYFGR